MKSQARPVSILRNNWTVAGIHCVVDKQKTYQHFARRTYMFIRRSALELL
jgi:hypothetical protein